MDTAGGVACGAQGSQPCTKKADVVLAHASINQARACMRHLPQWEQRGCISKSLPPYSPALHRREIWGRCMQYYWLPFSAYMSLQSLLHSIEDILPRFGTDYTMAVETKCVYKKLCPPT
jgi:hypothetical protein